MVLLKQKGTYELLILNACGLDFPGGAVVKNPHAVEQLSLCATTAEPEL